MLSIATDYLADLGDPTPYLRRIAQNGFSHVHWCHEWSTDRLYSEAEIASYQRTLATLQLAVLDIHASAGHERNYGALEESERRAGVELVENRLLMASRLSASVVVLHLPGRAPVQSRRNLLEQVRRSFDELLPSSRMYGVRIALENMAGDDFGSISTLLREYGPEYLGVCYDTGHGNLCGGGGPSWLERFRERILSIHLHDNDGSADQHRLPFSGTSDWTAILGIISRSSYDKCPNLEVSMRGSGFEDEAAFLREALRVGTRLGNWMGR